MGRNTKRKVVQKMPTLDKGLNLLESEKQGAFHRLCLSHLERVGGEAIWIDSRNNSSTYTLNRLGDEKTLERLKVARAFTAYQHYTLLEQLEEVVDRNTELVLLPFMSSLYEDDELSDKESIRLLGEGLNRLQELIARHNLTVLVSMPDSRSHMLQELVEELADTVIESRNTGEGRSFRTEDFSSGFYRVGNRLLQTTLPYWRTHEPNRQLPEEVKAVGTY